MSGPPFPPLPPSSSAIGTFVIGVSPIGGPLIPSFDVWKTVISQYANSDIITQLIENLDAYVDQTTNFNNLYDLIWNVDTAVGYGLDVWGRIVGVTRVVNVPLARYLGFEQQSLTVDPFDQSPLYSGEPLTSGYALSDSAFRTLIFAKALANICDGSIPGINQVLLNLFPQRGTCYVTDGEDMTMTYTFAFTLSPVEIAIVEQSGILPKPVGVSATVVQL